MSSLLLGLLTRGALVGWASVALAAALGLALSPRGARSFRRLRARSALASLGRPMASIPAGDSVPAVLEGTLACDPAAPFAALACTRPDDDGTGVVFSSALAEGLVLVVDGHRLKVEGALEVIHGHPAARGPVDLAAHTADGSGHRFVFLHPGDRVRVAGVVEPLQGAGDGSGYRGERPTWRLRPGATGRAIVALVAPASVTLAPATRGLAALGVACAWAAVMTLAGLGLFAAADRARGPITRTEQRSVCAGGGAGALAAASAVPWLRASALDRLSVTLTCVSERTPTTRAALRRTHDALHTPCSEQAARFEELVDYDHAADTWARCATPYGWRRATRLYLSLGRMREASDALAHLPVDPRDVRVGDVLRVHLLAKQRVRAAEVARAIGEEHLRFDAARPTTTAMTMLCADAALRASAGDGAARARLQQLLQQAAQRRGERVCSILSAWVTDAATRPLLAAGVERSWPNGYGLTLAPAMHRIAAAESIEAALGGGTASVTLLEEAARFAANTGDVDGARRAQEALRAVAVRSTEGAAASERLDAELTLAARGPDGCASAAGIAQSAIVGELAWRCDLLEGLRGSRDAGGERWREAGLDAPGTLPGLLLRGDAAGLRDLLRGVDHAQVRDATRVVFFAAALRTEPRATLGRWLATEHAWADDDHPAIVRSLVARRAAALATGDRALVREVEAVLRRHRDALVDDDLAAVWYAVTSGRL